MQRWIDVFLLSELLLPWIKVVSSLPQAIKITFSSGRKRHSDWVLGSDLIETLFVACEILGLWHAPKNSQNVIPPLSLPPLQAPFYYFFSRVSCISPVSMRGNWAERGRKDRKGLDSDRTGDTDTHWNTPPLPLNKWFERTKLFKSTFQTFSQK